MAFDLTALTGYDPPGAFYFDVRLLPPTFSTTTDPSTLAAAALAAAASLVDASFQEVSGIERELEVEPVGEGGENRFKHQLPRRGKHPNLVLKRGVVPRPSPLAMWAEATVGSSFAAPIQPMSVLVTLMSAKWVLIVWKFDRAYPVKWATSTFNSEKNELAVETLEMAYATVERWMVPNPAALL